MRIQRFFYFIAAILFLLVTSVSAQTGKGIISGEVKDTQGAALPGATIVFEPQLQTTVSSGQGSFDIANVPAGKYSVTITYQGFAPFTDTVTVASGQVAHIEAKLKVASTNDEVLVTAERPKGEAAAINRTNAAENLIEVLPGNVLTSLPNANIADALGRMTSVTLERDEGEGKYVQIRGTEPRLSNTMIDGVTVPSQESGVRQVKLDALASDLVDSVEINKTLQANIDSDGIGGSVNLVTKTAGEAPMVSAYGIGGYTPILGGRDIYQYGLTTSARVGPAKKLGMLIGGTYDYNGRGINDIEPSPTADSLTPHYDGMDIRDYVYYRTRWGLAGSLDYKLNEGSNIAIRGFYSTFQDYGNKFVFQLNDFDFPKYSQDWRRPDFGLGSISVTGRHLHNASTFNWLIAASRGRQQSGSGSAKYKWNKSVGDPDIDSLCFNDQTVAASVYRPGWSAGCFGTGADNTEDRNNYKLTTFELPLNGHTAQVNLQAGADYARQYHFGSHFGTFELGGKIRNAHKFDDTYQLSASPSEPVAAHPEWASSFTDSNYYDKTYHVGTVTDYNLVRNWALANLSFDGKGINDVNYDFIERITAGYLMNTIELTSRLRFVAGVRFEATHLSTLAFDDNADPTPTKLTVKGGGDYLSIMPSASLRFAVTKNSDFRVVFGRGLARPNPQDIAQPQSVIDTSINPNAVSIGNPNLQPEYAWDYDLLYENFLPHIGLFQAGFFYKDLSNPIVTLQTLTSNFPGNVGTPTFVTQPVNAGSAYIAGFETAFQQRMSYLPGVMKNFGVSANFGYSTSEAKGVNPLRTDSPALLRQAPYSWNFSPTYDTKKLSLRFGMSYNAANIFAYQYTNLQYLFDGSGNPIVDPVTGKQETGPNPQVGGTKGPAGDNYLYPHLQMDVQATYKLPMGFEAYGFGLNLNNEVFGFYNGNTQYVVQREYYHSTYAGGLKWNMGNREKK